jgi:hypothetical protein
MDKGNPGRDNIDLLGRRGGWGRTLVIASLLLMSASSAQAQAGPVILRAGKWIGEQLIGYGTGKVIDKLAGLDCEEELRQVEASLSVQLKKERSDKEKIRAELAATQSQLQIINSLLRTKPTSTDIAEFRRQLVKDLDKVLVVQEEHDQRITQLEREVADLTMRLRRIEAGPRLVDTKSLPEPGVHETPEPQSPKPKPKYFNVSVAAVARWMKTGIILAQGESVAIQASGSAATVPGTYSGPRGQRYRCDTTCSFPGGYYGQLVGKIGANGRPFAVGEQANIFAPSSGELFLAVNDCCDWSDNDGAFTAFISVGSGG